MDKIFVLLFFVIVVGIPVVGGIGSKMFSTWLAHKEQMAGALNAQAAERGAQYAAHTDRLEQRVRVLERIVTDPNNNRGADLSLEIERLRDERSAPTPLN